MGTKRRAWPKTVPVGSVIVKIYKVRNKSYKLSRGRTKARYSFKLSYHAAGQRYQKMCATLAQARAEAKTKAAAISSGQLSVVKFNNVDASELLYARDVLKPTGMSVALMAKDCAEAWALTGGKISMTELARQSVRTNAHNLPSITLPEAVDDPAEWKKNALRHSFISYRVAETQDVAQVALEAGNSPQIIFQHYRELVRLKEALRWFAIEPDGDGKAVLVDSKPDIKPVGQPKDEIKSVAA